MKTVLTSDDEYPFLDAKAKAALTDWQSSDTRQHILALVPEYRLSKFQRALPDSLQVEMVGQYLVDFEGTEAFVHPQPK